MSHPFFSIVVPTYNREQLIVPTIQSLLAIDYQGYEIIIVDDGSTDHTEQIIANINDDKLRYFKKQNGERGAARNFGVAKAIGDYVTFLDSDDLVYPNHLTVAAKLVEGYNQPELFLLAHDWLAPSGEVIKKGNLHGDLNKKILKGNIFSCIGVFIRADVAIANPFSENRRLSGTEDWLLWLKLAARYNIHYDNVVTSALVDHDGRSVKGFNEQEMLERANLLILELQSDKVFMDKFGAFINSIKAHMFSYISIHLALSGEKGNAIKYLLKAAVTNFDEVLSKRTLAIIKHSLLSV